MDETRHIPEAAPIVPPRVDRRSFVSRHAWGLMSLGVVVLSFVLSPDHPTGGVEICPMKRLSGLPCPGCGITRSICWTSRGRLDRAFHMHPLGTATWLAAVVGATSLVWSRRFRERFSEYFRRRQRAVVWITNSCVALLLLFGILRILFQLTRAPAWWPW